MSVLSINERMVLAYAATGLSRIETAGVMCVPDHRVPLWRKSAIAALGARNLTHAVAIATQEGLIGPLPDVCADCGRRHEPAWLTYTD